MPVIIHTFINIITCAKLNIQVNEMASRLPTPCQRHLTSS